MDAQSGSRQPRVMFRSPDEEEEEEDEAGGAPQRRLGKLTIKYNRRDLQRRLDIEQWMETQVQQLFDCEQEEEIPELQIDIDELLDLTDSEQRSRLKTILQECGKATEDFINGLLYRIRGLHKMRK